MRNTRIKAARAEKDMTQKELAEAVGVTRQTMNAIEQGAYNPTIRLCRSICAVLGKSLDELFGSEPEPEPTFRRPDNAMYCERCCFAFEGDTCPLCGRRKLRPAGAEDLCLLAEKEQIWSEMLADVLRQNNIPFLRKAVLGAAITLRTGLSQERYRFFVAYRDLRRAKGAVEQLFGDDYT